MHLPTKMPPWARQCGRAFVALCLGAVVGLSASEPKLLIAVAAILVVLFVTASLRRPDPLVFFAFFAISIPKLSIPGSPIPLGEALMLLAVFSALLTLKQDLNRVPRWAGIAMGALFGAYVLSAMVNTIFSFQVIKRLLHMSVYFLAIAGLTRGLLSTRVALRGIQIGLMISVISSIFLYPVSTYAGRLTGLFGDPNVAGLLIVVLGSVALWGIEKRRNQLIYGAILGIGLFMTFSRTGIMAAALAGVWVWAGRKLRPIPAVGAVILITALISVLPTSVQQVGPFNDRSGSDQLRTRVSAQEFKLVKQKPIFGHGPGSATVLVNFGTTKFYFHNSYLELLDEAGGIGMFFFMIMLLGTFLALISLDSTDRQPLLEGAIVGVAIVGINLGEVLMELSAAVAIGFALAHVVAVRRAQKRAVQLEFAR